MFDIQTTNGTVRGSQSEYDEAIRVFKGLPYAAPPVGDLRWRPPQTVESWDGVRDATSFSASCSQPTNTSGFVWRRGDFEVSEDCLYLNVWSPNDAKDLPVMVWIHGGAHTSGQGHAQIFDGTELASQGVVLVTINYRLGPFGFLAHPWLAEESGTDSAGNYGLMDKIAALTWVKDNIGEFGGDPGNVTVFGQSAGSQSICSLMASSLAKGLFHKAIGQSAACVDPAPKRDADGRERGQKLVSELSATNLNELRDVSASKILEASDRSGWANGSRIVIDGQVLTEPQIETYRSGGQSSIPLMVGSLSDEGNQLFPVNAELTEEELDSYLDYLVGADARDLKELYTGSPGEIQHGVATDMFMAFGMRRWAEYNVSSGNETYLYFMNHVPPAFHIYMPENPVLDLPDGPRSGGAYHSGDLAYVFGNLDKVGLGWTDEDKKLSETMVRYWTNFATTGDPNSGPAVLPPWERFDCNDCQTMLLNDLPATTQGVRRPCLDILARHFPI